MIMPIAYTDGACLGNPGPGGWGVRILYPDGRVRELGGVVRSTTNNRMELQAAIEALKVLQSCSQATLVTDSRYVIDGLTRWLHNWRRRGWMTTANTPVKNRDLWLTLEPLNHSGIHWQHVRGHISNPYNERVDTIAQAFAKGTTPELFCGPVASCADPLGAASAALASQPSPPPAPATGDRRTQSFRAARYVSIVRGTATLDHTWAACEARVRGVSGARYKKVRTQEELAAFCAKYRVKPPGV
ncbi:Ribonuclease H [Candidatus Entotheonellaceae bacterium PAL068K]